MKFERKYTKISSDIVVYMIFACITLTLLCLLLNVLQECTYAYGRAMDCKIFGITDLYILLPIGLLTLASYFALFIAYIGKIVVTGLEKPKFISSKKAKHNKNQNLRLRLGRGKQRPFGGRYVYLG